MRGFEVDEVTAESISIKTIVSGDLNMSGLTLSGK